MVGSTIYHLVEVLNFYFTLTNPHMTEVTDPFLPEDYQEPSNSDYVRFEPWTHKLRILEKPILCYDVRHDVDENGNPKKFSETFRQEPNKPIPIGAKVSRACLVYNYGEKRVQIRNISQKQIRDTLATFYRDKDYGSPLLYDLKIVREWAGQTDTKYNILPLPKAELSPEAKNVIANIGIDWDIYFDNKNKNTPFFNKEDASDEAIF